MRSKYILAYCLLLHGAFLHAQVSLPYYSGFDTPDERAGWTIYRLGEAALGNWSTPNAGGFSAPACISHDYSPSTGANVVDDWFVSPGFLIPTGGTLDSVRYAFSGFSVPSPGDTIGVYLLLGDQDPALASAIFELTDFRDDLYQADNMYRLLANIPLPATNEMAFIGLRYRNAEASSRWLHVRFDNIAVSGLTTSMEDPANQIHLAAYPNPTTDQVTIVHQETGGDIWLFDQKGMLLQQCALNPGQISSSLSLMQWPKGTYLLMIRQPNRWESVILVRI